MVRKHLIKCRGEKSLKEVADDISITPQMLGMIEKGIRTPSLNLANRISIYYQTPIEQLFFNQNRNDSCLKVSDLNK